MRCDKDAFALGQQMANHVCDSMRFACAGRTLHDNAIAPSKLLGNFELLSIRRFAQQYLVIFVAERS